MTEYKRAMIESKRARSTVAQRLAALSSYFEFLRRPIGAAEKPILTFNPVRSVSRKDVSQQNYRTAKAIEWEKIERMLEAMPDDVIGCRDRAILLFFAYTGRRRSEVAALRIRDLDLNSNPMTYRCRVKGGHVETFELPTIVYDAIKRYWVASGRLPRMTKDSAVFTHVHRLGVTMRKRPEATMSDKAMSEVLKRAARRVGLDGDPELHLHAIRHRYAEDAEAGGASSREIQKALSHKSLKTTEAYLARLGKVRGALADPVSRVRQGAPRRGTKGSPRPGSR